MRFVYYSKNVSPTPQPDGMREALTPLLVLLDRATSLEAQQNREMHHKQNHPRRLHKQLWPTVTEKQKGRTFVTPGHTIRSRLLVQIRH